MDRPSRLAIGPNSNDAEIVAAVDAWIEVAVPEPWRVASLKGRQAIRAVRSRVAYRAWYPAFAASGLVVASWPVNYGGLNLEPHQARLAEQRLAPFNLGRLNPLGLHNMAPALFAHGTEDQRLRFLPPMVANTERWCQMFSEPGAGSDLASLAMRAQRDGDEWVLSGQKVWSTWAHESEFAICLARTDPAVPKRKGITYFLVDLRSPGVEVRELRHLGGSVDFNEVWLDEVRVPDFQRVGAEGDGWRVAASTLAGERQMVAGSGSGGVDRIGGSGISRLIEKAKECTVDPITRDRLSRLYAEERIRAWTNQRVRATVSAGGTPGAAASVGKVHQGALNQQIQLLACDMLGPAAQAFDAAHSYHDALPYEVSGMLRSRANTIEGGTTEVNKNVIGEKVLGLPREPDPYHGASWEDTPR
ncbi:MAG: acyl-CoA dehydrogenase [Acidimicrobiaceae bacterium]|nr:acyl-CoA dehydrogenase [Acidimicrobiaceae bacterium]MYC42468.1 acyl-CoA dehydrogenase [Acidimicrobiaceae bacterium]MYH88133.1 acyl-CoA dehydrogenase [Acidimicrobiaceae bacterium]